MRTLGNIIWLLLGGLWMALGYLVAGVIMFVLIVTIPFGVQAFKLGMFTLWPFGRTLVKKPDAGAASFIGNVLWLLLAGWWLAFGHLVSALVSAITIIGIPFAVAHGKLALAALWPFGREVVPIWSLGPGQEAITVRPPAVERASRPPELVPGSPPEQASPSPRLPSGEPPA